MRKSLWRRFVDWFAGDGTPGPAAPAPGTPTGSPAPAGPAKYRPAEQHAPITVLSKGDVFDFQVFADLEWSTTAMTYAELTTQAAEHTPAAHEELLRRVWRIGRTHSPYHSAEAEAEMRRKAVDLCYDTPHGRIQCSVDIRVMPDDRVRKHLLPHAQREIENDAEAALGAQKADMVRSLVSRWHAVLSEVGVSPLSVAGARLSDAGFAAVLERLAADRRDRAQDLVGVLRQASMDHEQLGMFEYAQMYAAAAASYLGQLNEEDREFVRKLLSVDPEGGQP